MLVTFEERKIKLSDLGTLLKIQEENTLKGITVEYSIFKDRQGWEDYLKNLYPLSKSQL